MGPYGTLQLRLGVTRIDRNHVYADLIKGLFGAVNERGYEKTDFYEAVINVGRTSKETVSVSLKLVYLKRRVGPYRNEDFLTVLDETVTGLYLDRLYFSNNFSVEPVRFGGSRREVELDFYGKEEHTVGAAHARV